MIRPFSRFCEGRRTTRSGAKLLRVRLGAMVAEALHCKLGAEDVDKGEGQDNAKTMPSRRV